MKSTRMWTHKSSRKASVCEQLATENHSGAGNLSKARLEEVGVVDPRLTFSPEMFGCLKNQLSECQLYQLLKIIDALL